jgi:branched-chain amino acid aminotransferase
MYLPPASKLRVVNGAFISGESDMIKPPDMRILYEVFRLESGKAIFIMDHIERLYAGAVSLMHILPIEKDELILQIKSFIRQSGAINGNIRIEFWFKDSMDIQQYYSIFFLPTAYPSASMYKNGVQCSLLERSRVNPNVKVANPLLRAQSDAIIEAENVYETILHTNGVITEGSRSNLFFVGENGLQTAPSDLVLAGIMRQKVLEVAGNLKIPVSLIPVSISELNKYNAAFITGTSPRVLPVNRIDDFDFHVPHSLVNKISDEIAKLIGMEKT